MRKSREFLSMPVVTIAEGQQIGTVKGLVLDPSQHAVVALVLEQKGLFKEQKYIPFNKITSAGDDVITVDRSASAERGNSLPNIIKLLKDNVQIINSRIITQNGTLLGYAGEFYVDTTSGQVIGLELTDRFPGGIMQGKAFLDSHYIQTIGQEVIICSNDAAENIVQVDGGIQEKIKHFKDSTSQVWGTTRQKTREFSSSLGKWNRSRQQDKPGNDEDRSNPPGE